QALGEFITELTGVSVSTQESASAAEAKSQEALPDTITVVLADDHVILRTSLALFLDSCEGIKVVGEAANGDEAYKMVLEHTPRVLLLDLNMPGTSGLTILPSLRQDFPNLRILVLTGRDENIYIMKALRAGANGYILKTIEEKELQLAVEDVAAGNMVLGHGVAEKVVAGLGQIEKEPLDAIERDIMLCVAAGLDKPTIAHRMGIPEDEITAMLIHIIDSLKVKSETDAALMALRAGWISLDEVHNF
ncbi:MAG: response regulator transcription factor, partial [Anaerolineae bacterium]|nr:response regulator transcription factor [Anaerolineae bacterium]